jgi:hypothetical protein
VALREVLAQFNIEVDDAQLAGLEKKLGTTQNKLAGFGRMLGAGLVFRAVKGFISDAAASGAQIERLSERLGIGTGDVQRFGYMAGQSGVDMEAAARAATFLEKSVGLAAEGNKAASLEFARLGVSVRDSSGHTKNFKELLPEVAEGIKGLGDRGLQTEATVKLFGRAGAALLPMLLEGADGVSALSKEFDDLGIEVKGPALKNLEKLQKQFDANKLKMQALGMEVVNRLAPALMKLASGNVVMKLKDMAEKTNMVEMAMGALAVAAGVRAAPAMLKFLATLNANAGSMLLIGGLVLLAIALEDIYGFTQGKKSLFGEWFKANFGDEEAQKTAKEWGETLHGMALYLQEINVVDFGSGLAVGIKTLMAALKALGGALRDTVYLMGELMAVADGDGDFSEIKRVVGNFGKNFDNIGKEGWGGDKNMVTLADGRRVSKQGAVEDGDSQDMDRALTTKKRTDTADATELDQGIGLSKLTAPAPRGWSTNPYDAPRPNMGNAPITNNVTVNVPPGTDGKGVGKATVREMQDFQRDNSAHLAAVQTGGR